MTTYSPIQLSTSLAISNRGNIMEKRHKRPILIRFNSNKEAVDIYVRIELKYFLAKLLYFHPGWK